MATNRAPVVGQGLYYLVSGIWPFVGMKSFQAVTGPKASGWLVRTVGALVAVVGAGLVSAGWRRRVTPELAFIGGGCAAALAGIGAYYPLKGRLSKVYLADAALEGALAWWWATSGRRLTEGVSGLAVENPAPSSEWADWREQPHFPLE